MIKTIAIVVVALLVVSVAGVLLLAVSKPDTFRVQRTSDSKPVHLRVRSDTIGW